MAKLMVDWRKSDNQCTLVVQRPDGVTGKIAVITLDDIQLSVFLDSCQNHNREVDLWGTKETTDDNLHRDRPRDA
jgi:hypothetical protein